MNFLLKYRPYNYSSTKCHVVTLKFNNVGRFGIDEKLPAYIGVLKGIYVTVNCDIPDGLIGGIFLSFNEGAAKTFQLYLPNTKMLRDMGLPYPVEEIIKSNSIMQGYYHISENFRFPSGTVKIYLHYIPCDQQK